MTVGSPSPSAVAEGIAAGDKVKVVVRVRPFSRRENGTDSVTQLVDHCTIRLTHPGEKSPKLFAFDFCFSVSEAGAELDKSVVAALPTDQQQQMFETVGTELVDNSFLGLNSCIFAYGQTGSGKSYTMMGTPDEPGIIPRLCTELFERLARETSNDGTRKFKLEMSFYEVYNERIRDLLGPPSKGCALSSKRFPSLKVREHSLFGPMVEGLSVYKVNNYDQIERLIEIGNGARTTAATLMNETSSRSHSVFSLKLTQTIADADDETFTGEKVSKISLIDLAGSERVQKTGAVGKRLEEGGNINRSLTALGKVIAALAEKRGNQFVPYRDSVLTWLLKENLGGNSRTTMIATISPSADNYEETLSTLRFADRAKRIQTHAVVNEDPNAKIIRELREEVERLRLLNQSHAEQNEQYQQAMEQITQRHQEDKCKALETQYEKFTQYIAQLSSNQQQQQNVQSPSTTPMTPFGGSGIVPSTSMANGICYLGQRDKGKFLEWAHRREELFAVHLEFLRKSIQQAAALAAEANSVVAAMATNGSPNVHYSVSLHIPAGNLRPSKLNVAGGDDGTEEEALEGGCVCEPIIVAKWKGRRLAQQQWTVEQMECKLAELRTGNNKHGISVGDNLNLPLFSNNLLARREKHSLIGVANVYLGHLLLCQVPKMDSQVLVINQQGEICGKMIVRIQRMEVRNALFEDDDDDYNDDYEDEDNFLGPEKYLGRSMLCRVEIDSLNSLNSDHCRLVFCQYSLHECPQVVVPSEEGPPEAQNTAIRINSAHEFEVICTRPFFEYVEEDALSIEVWGHRTSPDDDDAEEDADAEEGEVNGENGRGRMEPSGNRHAGDETNAGEFVHNDRLNLCDLVNQKKKSLQERWGEVTKRLEIWVELLELNSAGDYVPVTVKLTNNNGAFTNCGTGGVYKLRHGQQRRIRLQLKSWHQSEDVAHGTLPLRFSDIQSVSIGSIIVVDEDESHNLDSYQEADLARIRHQWGDLLQRRANYLQGEIQSLSSKKPPKSAAEGERERFLLQNWLELVEERNAISVPTSGIPGAPTEWNWTAEQNVSAGFERHCPLTFLQDGAQSPAAAGSANFLPMERPEECQLALALLEKRVTETWLECSCPWDSSLHECPALNRNSRGNECIFLIVKLLISISHPFPTEILLRKRICLNIGEPNSAGGGTIWPWSRRPDPLTGTGLFVDVVACIPKSSLDFEHREVLAKLAVQHATSCDQTEDGADGDLSLVSFGSSALPGALADYSPRDGANSNYLSEYVSKTIHAVEWLIKLDRLRQEEAIRRAVAKLCAERTSQPVADRRAFAQNGRMTRTISLPTTIGGNVPSKHTSPFDDHAEGEKRVPFPWVTVLHQNHHTHTVHPQMVKSSQSHTDGFSQLLQTRPSTVSTSASSSGYASMVNSIVNPCTNRLAGIDEEEGAIGGGSGRGSATGDNGNECQAVVGEQHQPHTFTSKAINALSSPEGTAQNRKKSNCFTSNNLLMMRDPLQQFSSSNGLVEALSSSSSSASSSSTASTTGSVAATSSSTSCCCVENRLFSPSPRTFPTAFAPGASSPNSSSSNSSSISSAATPRPSTRGGALLFFHNTAKTITMARGDNCGGGGDGDSGGDGDGQGTTKKRKKKPVMMLRMNSDANGDNCPPKSSSKTMASSTNARRMGFLN
uniref:Kinesin motor domain-containing protein n=1 Tax=Globodera rostochiensis TaxID=31243 RepID=A0A914I7I8_GLORO